MSDPNQQDPSADLSSDDDDLEQTAFVENTELEKTSFQAGNLGADLAEGISDDDEDLDESGLSRGLVAPYGRSAVNRRVARYRVQRLGMGARHG